LPSPSLPLPSSLPPPSLPPPPSSPFPPLPSSPSSHSSTPPPPPRARRALSPTPPPLPLPPLLLLSAIFSLHSALFLCASLSWVTLMGWDGNTFSESCSDRHRGARHFPLPGGTVTLLAPTTHTHTHTHTHSHTHTHNQAHLE